MDNEPTVGQWFQQLQGWQKWVFNILSTITGGRTDELGFRIFGFDRWRKNQQK